MKEEEEDDEESDSNIATSIAFVIVVVYHHRRAVDVASDGRHCRRRGRPRGAENRDRTAVARARLGLHREDTIGAIRTRAARGEVGPAAAMQRLRGPLRKHEA